MTCLQILTAVLAVAATMMPADAWSQTAGWSDGFVLQSDDGDFRLQFGGTVQLDGRVAVDDPQHAIAETFLIRKLRPIVTAQIARYFEFRMMLDFGNGAAVLADGYFDLRLSRAFRIRTGKDKTPVGLEFMHGDSFVLFPERSLATGLVPARDLGVQVLGEVAGGAASYAVGVFNGVPDGASSTTDMDTSSSKDLAGRVVVSPFWARAAAPALSGLGIAFGGSAGKQSGPLPVFRTSASQTYFSYDRAAIANGMRVRITPGVSYYYEAFGAFGEYVRSRQHVSAPAIDRDIANHAWELTGSYMLTGEAATDHGVKPKKPFSPPDRQWGAFQLLGRYTELTVDRQAFDTGLTAPGASGGARSFAFGANWYPNAYIKYYASYEQTMFERGVGEVRHTERVFIFRAQLAF